MPVATKSRPASDRFFGLAPSFAVSSAIALAVVLLLAPRPAAALAVNGFYTDDSRCDGVSNQAIGHEIGESTSFPIDSRIAVTASPTAVYACVGDDGAPNDFIVQITNLSPYTYTDLFFVADDGISIGNADGNVADVIGAPTITTDAFRIDGTVTTGVNNNLIYEGGIVNEIFEPGETWRFLVTNVLFPANVPPLLVFDSAGGFAGSSVGYPPSTASILGTRVIVPELSAMHLLGLGFAGIALRRRAVA